MVEQELELENELPAGWTMVTVADVGEVRLGRQRSPDKHTGRFITKYIRAANITANGLDLEDILEMDFTPAEREVFHLKAGDIVLAEASESILTAFRERVRPSFEKITENSRESVMLSKLRDTLLPKLISGELTIPDAEKLLEGNE